MKVLAIDIGGSHIRIMANRHRKERKAEIGPDAVGARHGGCPWSPGFARRSSRST